MIPECFFLRYAFPCAFIIRQRGEIGEAMHEKLKEAAINNIPLEKELLEKVFHKAFSYIIPLAEKMNMDKWDIEVLKKYFYEEHNRIIDSRIGIYKDAPESLRTLSKVLKAEVIGVKDDILTVKYGNQTRNVLDSFVKGAQIGDNVTIHYAYAVETA